MKELGKNGRKKTKENEGLGMRGDERGLNEWCGVVWCGVVWCGVEGENPGVLTV